MILSHQRKIAVGLLILYWPALFILAHIPIPRVVRQANVSDKSLHFLAYLILTFLIWSAVSGDRKVKWRRAAPWLVLFVIALYGILDEWLQTYISERSCDIRDYFTDLTGAVIALILSSFFTFWPAGLIVTAIFIFGINNVTRANLAEMLPKINAVFHFFAYAILTFFWIQCMRLFSRSAFGFQCSGTHEVRRSVPILQKDSRMETSRQHGKDRWLILALAGPVGFLIFVELFSVVAGKELALSEIIVSFAAIAAVVIGFYIRVS
jgi:VanZ family protein